MNKQYLEEVSSDPARRSVGAAATGWIGRKGGAKDRHDAAVADLHVGVFWLNQPLRRGTAEDAAGTSGP